jgi:predicted  nucleic acid-binding Zn-ribbon protein
VPTSHLYDLQQVDVALVAVRAHRQNLNDGTPQHVTAALVADRLRAVQQEAAAAQARLRALELEIQAVQAKRAKLEADMYSGRIGNPKELAAMHEDVSALGRHKAHLEDEVLGLLEQAEDLDRQQREAQDELTAAEADLVRTLDEYRRGVETTDQEIAALTTRRQHVAAQVDEDLIRRYDRLREQKGGVAVVAVRSGVCDGCHVAVPHRVVSRLERDPDLIAACDRCGRLLVVLP